jgi:hypothetical protein
MMTRRVALVDLKMSKVADEELVPSGEPAVSQSVPMTAFSSRTDTTVTRTSLVAQSTLTPRCKTPMSLREHSTMMTMSKHHCDLDKQKASPAVFKAARVGATKVPSFHAKLQFTSLLRTRV